MTERYSRIPIYKDNIDNIIGILHTRDYLEQLLKTDFPNLNQLIQPAHFIYRSKRQKRHEHKEKISSRHSEL